MEAPLGRYDAAAAAAVAMPTCGSFPLVAGGAASAAVVIRKPTKRKSTIFVALTSLANGCKHFRHCDFPYFFNLLTCMGDCPDINTLLGRAGTIHDSKNRESIQNPDFQHFQMNRESMIHQNERILLLKLR